MMEQLQGFAVLNLLAVGAYWTAVVVFVLASLCLAIIALRDRRRGIVYGSAAGVALALAAVAVPGPSAPVGVRVVLGIITFALGVVGGGPAARVVLSLASHGSVSDGANGGILVENREARADSSEPPTHEVLRGGTAIGLLERFATIGAIFAGFPEAIAVIVAIKSVGRFSELDAAEARERFIIGTLASLSWACACAAVLHFAAS